MASKRSTREPIADQMYEVLLQQFLSGRRKAGEPLNIGALTRELGVSQTPLREALARLEHTGLVHREALRGYRVADELSPREIAKLLDARAVIEPALALEAGLRVTPEFLAGLETNVDELDTVVETADVDAAGFEQYWNADYDFHRRIAAQSDNPFLEQALVSLDGAMQRFRLFTKRGHTGVADAAREHRKILDAFNSRDAEQASDLMREHLELAKAQLQA